MKAEEKKIAVPKITVESERSKYAGKPLNSDKEKAAKKIEGKAMEILKQHGLIK